MYCDRTVGVVVPAYNEAGLVGDVVAALPAFVDRVYAVEDRSTDDTWDELQGAVDTAAREAGTEVDAWPLPEEGPLPKRVERAVRGGRLVALRHAENQGAGGAVKTGYLAALAGPADLVATVDGDGQMDPAILDRFLDPLVRGEAGYAKGTRFARRGDRREMPPLRRVGNAALTHLARVATGFRALSDPVNGYTAITRAALERVDVTALHEGYGYGVDVLGALHTAGVDVVDVPHPSRYGAETSSIRYRTYVPRVSRLLVGVGLRRLRRERRDHSDGRTHPNGRGRTVGVGPGEDAGADSTAAVEAGTDAASERSTDTAETR